MAESNRPTREERFWAKVNKTEACWLWTAARSYKGYGVFGHRPGAAVTMLAHRIAYELCVGPIPEGLTIDHLCKVKICVRPEHLEAVTMAENLRRADGWAGLNYRKTHCPKGHSYAEHGWVNKRGQRICGRCSTIRVREWRAKTGRR